MRGSLIRIYYLPRDATGRYVYEIRLTKNGKTCRIQGRSLVEAIAAYRWVRLCRRDRGGAI